MTERIKGLVLEVHVGAAVADVVVVHRRKLRQRLGPGLIQTSSGSVVAEENVGQRGAFFLRGMRDVDDCGYVVLNPLDGIRKAGDKHYNRPRIDGVDLANKVFLGQIDGLAVTAFAPLTCGSDGRVRIVRGRIEQAQPDDGTELAAKRIVYVCFRQQVGLDSLLYLLFRSGTNVSIWPTPALIAAASAVCWSG